MGGDRDERSIGHRRIALGARGEEMARQFLVRRGMKLLELNYRCRVGEIDIVARDGDVLVFVEVKLRRGTFDGLEAVDARKQRQITRTAFDFMIRNGMLGRPARFDVVAVDRRTLECTHVIDAFDSTIEY